MVSTAVKPAAHWDDQHPSPFPWELPTHDLVLFFLQAMYVGEKRMNWSARAIRLGTRTV